MKISLDCSQRFGRHRAYLSLSIDTARLHHRLGWFDRYARHYRPNPPLAQHDLRRLGLTLVGVTFFGELTSYPPEPA